MDTRRQDRIAKKVAEDEACLSIGGKIAKSIVADFEPISDYAAKSFYNSWRGSFDFEEEMDEIVKAIKGIDGVDDAVLLKDQMRINTSMSEGNAMIKVTAFKNNVKYIAFDFRMGDGWSGWANISSCGSPTSETWANIRSIETNKLVSYAVRMSEDFVTTLKLRQKEMAEGKKYEFGFDGRGMAGEVWLTIKGVDDKEKKETYEKIVRRFPKLEYDWKAGCIRFGEYYGMTSFNDSDLAREPFKSVCDYLQALGYTKKD